jgi:hypothetical protein
MSSKNFGFSISIFVPDEELDSLRIVEKSGWTGVGVVFNRSIYKEVSNIRDEFNRTGIYILIGESEEGSFPTIYIGEGDPVADRLASHYRDKEFWSWALFFATKDNSLNKAHVKFLESRLLQIAKEAKRCKLENSKDSSQPTLSEAETSNVEAFLHNIRSILPLLGLTVFEKTKVASKKSILKLYIKAKGIKATGYEGPNGFVVFEGSESVKAESPSIHNYLTESRRDLIQQEVLVEQGEQYKLTQDYTFNSPSTAAGILLGRNSNGRIEWKDKNGKTLKEYQEEIAAKEN